MVVNNIVNMEPDPRPDELTEAMLAVYTQVTHSKENWAAMRSMLFVLHKQAFCTGQSNRDSLRTWLSRQPESPNLTLAQLVFRMGEQQVPWEQLEDWLAGFRIRRKRDACEGSLTTSQEQPEQRRPEPQQQGQREQEPAVARSPRAARRGLSKRQRQLREPQEPVS